ncbi:MAG: DNA-directed RNA polymerase [Thaumarchaeota archaeon]|nr:DNA-directed RNA polymerase [Nitrososphaerota archaeon]
MGFERGEREMHKITCSDCGKEAEVPFKPSGDRPVYCKDCFSKRRGSFR